MAKHYGFFAKWWDFFLHPSEMFESVLLEPVDRAATVVVPQFILVLSLFFFLSQLPHLFGGAAAPFKMTFTSYAFIIAVYFFFMHGFMRLFGGHGSVADTFISYGYGALFFNYTVFCCVILMFVAILIYPYLVFLPLLFLLVLEIWCIVSMIIGFRLAHGIGAGRVILAMLCTGILGMLVYLMTTDLLFSLF